MAAAPPFARARVPQILVEALERADDSLLAGSYRALSVSTARVRSQLRAAHRPFVDPQRPDVPPLPDLDATAAWVIAQASAQAAAIGGVAGMVGAASVPSETATTVLGVIRLAQRLAVVYGFDPDTDRGQMALWRALAAGFQVELPDRGPVGMRVRDLPAILLLRKVAPRDVGGALASSVVRRALRMVVGRTTRLLPVLSSRPAAVDAAKRTAELGERMQAVLRQLAEVPLAAIPLVEEAVELR